MKSLMKILRNTIWNIAIYCTILHLMHSFNHVMTFAWHLDDLLLIIISKYTFYKKKLNIIFVYRFACNLHVYLKNYHIIQPLSDQITKYIRWITELIFQFSILRTFFSNISTWPQHIQHLYDCLMERGNSQTDNRDPKHFLWIQTCHQVVNHKTNLSVLCPSPT